MYELQIRDHVMIAHSIPGEAFGPAQQLHGATYVVDVIFFRPDLGDLDIVVDIGAAADALKALLADLNFRNLDEHPDFQATRSTTERVARWVFDRMAARIADGGLGEDAKAITALKVTLHESHVALAGYQGTL